MKFNYKKLIFLILFIYWSITSTPLTDGSGDVVTPFILNFNPSLITVKKGYSSGSSISYDNGGEYLDISIGFCNRLNKSGFSLLYNNYHENKRHEIISAFSTKALNLNFGSDFKFIIENDNVDFTLDVAANYLFSNDIYAGLLVGNIFNSDITKNLRPFEVNLFSGGKIPIVKEFYFNFKGGLLLYNNYSEPGASGYLSLNKYFLKNPSLNIYGESEVMYDNKGDVYSKAGGALGIKIKLEKFSLNINCGSNVNIESLNNNVYVEFSIDSKRIVNDDELKCNINTDIKDSEIIISTKGTFESEKANLKRWTMFIYSKNLKNDNIIKTFSGGNIPPTSIIWNKRDSSGKLVDKGEYYVKLVIIDSLNRTIQSNRTSVNVVY